MKKLKQTLSHHLPDRERGQMLVILAVAMIGLLAAAGLAVDGGVLFMRKAQLDRAIDAAALAGVMDVYDGAPLATANLHGMQFMAANDVILYNEALLDETLTSCDDVDWDQYDYCGEPSTGSFKGSVRYEVQARWCAEVYFMQLLGFGEACPSGVWGIPIHGLAKAELSLPNSEILAPGSTNGLLDIPTTMSVLGPNTCRWDGNIHGDINDDKPGGNPGQLSTALASLEGTTVFRINIPESYQNRYEAVKIELFDPDSHNVEASGGSFKDEWAVWRRDGSMVNQGAPQFRDPECELHAVGGSEWASACILDVNQDDTYPIDANKFWFNRMDELRGDGVNGNCGTPNNVSDGNPTQILYRLYYYTAASDGTPQQVDIAYYVSGEQGDGNAKLTDLHWVTPTNDNTQQTPSFEYIITNNLLDDTLGPSTDWELRFNQTPASVGTAGETPIYCNDSFPGINDTRCFLAQITGTEVYDPISNPDPDHKYPVTVGAEPRPDAMNCASARTTYWDDGSGDPGKIVNSIGCVDVDGGGQDKDWENDFIVEWSASRNEIPDIIVGEDGELSLYLDVVPLDGSTENGWLVWAGPRPQDYPDPNNEPHYVPSEVNARNMFLYNLLEANPTEYANWHGSEGIAVGAQGPPTYNAEGFGTTHIPLLYVPPQMAGQEITVEIFDAENDPAQNDTRAPLYFHFDTLPVSDWSSCFDDVTGDGSMPGGWDCSIAPFEGSNEDDYTPVDLSGFYAGLTSGGGCCVPDADGHSIGNAYIDFYGGLNNQGSYDGVRRSDDGFISYTFALPAQVTNPPFGDVFRGGMLYASLWAGWSDTYALRVTVGGGSPVLVE